MTSSLECPPCTSIFNIEQWLWQKNSVTILNVTGNKNHRGVFSDNSKLEQTNAPVNIFHSLFKIIESKNV